MSTQHIPAWRRLGLKLKFANDAAANEASDLGTNGSTKKRKSEKNVIDTSGSDAQDHLLKKARVVNASASKKLKTGGHTSISGTPEGKFPHRKKSVTFTPDTKVEDGETAQTVQFWVPGSPGSTPMKVSAESSADHPEAPIKKPKREKRPRSQKEHSASAMPKKPAAALGYLDQFHHHRSSWKFNKNHETWILKHALSTEHIPSSQNLALADYLQGLKSMGSRQRLVDQSQEALRSDEPMVHNNTELHEKLLKALNTTNTDGTREIGDLDWVETLPRGKLILLGLNETKQQPQRSSRSGGDVLPRAKKNKSRTSRIEIESSSSSESESEDEDSDTSGSLKTPSGHRTGATATDSDEETSSSDSSLDSSEESEESDEDEGESDSS